MFFFIKCMLIIINNNYELVHILISKSSLKDKAFDNLITEMAAFTYVEEYINRFGNCI